MCTVGLEQYKSGLYVYSKNAALSNECISLSLSCSSSHVLRPSRCMFVACQQKQHECPEDMLKHTPLEPCSYFDLCDFLSV